MVFRNNYRPPRMRLPKVSMPGIKLTRYSFADRHQLKRLVPGTSVITIRNEYLTLYTQRSFEAAGRFKVKYYNLTVRGNVVVPFSMPLAETALVLLLKGKLHINISGLQTITLDETEHGNIVFPAGVHKQIFPSGEYHILLISLNKDFLKTHAVVYPFMRAMLTSMRCNKAHFTAIPFSTTIQQLTVELKNALSQDTSDIAISKCLFDAVVMQLIVHTFREISRHAQQQNKHSTNSDRMDLMEQVKTYIDKHYRELITVASIAKTFNIASGKMDGLFKLLTDKNTGEYLMEQRVKQAAHLLEFSDLTLEDIVHESGFKNTGYLCAAFEKTYNCLPLVYRAKRKSKGDIR